MARHLCLLLPLKIQLSVNNPQTVLYLIRDLKTFTLGSFKYKTEVYIWYVVNKIWSCLCRIRHTTPDKDGTTVTLSLFR